MFPIREHVNFATLFGVQMQVLGLPKLYRFLESHSDCEQQLLAWVAEVKEVVWATPNDIKARYSSVSFLADNRVIFNIKGNKYRLDTKVYYPRHIVMINRIGTHAEYKEWRF